MERNNQNAIYAYAFLGALLLIATLCCIVVNVGNIVALQLPVVMGALLLGTSALALLYTAIKMDGYRISDK